MNVREIKINTIVCSNIVYPPELDTNIVIPKIQSMLLICTVLSRNGSMLPEIRLPKTSLQYAYSLKTKCRLAVISLLYLFK